MDKNSILDQFRKNAGTAAPETPKQSAEPAPVGREPYAAFQEAEGKKHLWLRGKAHEADQAPRYSHLYNIVTDGVEVISLGFERMTVEINGRNLGKLLYLLLEHRVQWVQAYDVRKWGREPTDPALPIVTDITIHLNRSTLPPDRAEMH